MPTLTLNPLVPTQLGVTNPVAADMFGFDYLAGWRPVKLHFNVRLYGAVGDGVADDTAAIQRALDACRDAGAGIVFFPSGTYKVTSTLTIQKASSGVIYLNMAGGMAGFGATIQWAGGNNTSVFKSKGWKHSKVENVHVNTGTATGIAVWDVDGDATYTSTSSVSWLNCHVNIRNGTNNVAWRMGFSSGWLDISFLAWRDCVVEGDTQLGQTGQVGWNWMGGNALAFTWQNCFATSVSTGWTYLQASGSAMGNGGAGMTWLGGGASYNTIDYQPNAAGANTITGGRYEHSKQLVAYTAGGNSGNLTITGVVVTNYTPASGRVIEITGGQNLVLIGCQFVDFSGAYNANLITVSGTGTLGSLTVHGCSIRGTDPFYTVDATVAVNAHGNAIIDSTLVATGRFAERLPLQTSRGVAAWAGDSSADTAITIANNGTATPFGNANNFAGMFLINSPTTGDLGLFLTGGGVMVLVSQIGTLFTITSGTATKVNVYLAASVVTIENKQGGSQDFRVVAFRTRAST